MDEKRRSLKETTNEEVGWGDGGVQSRSRSVSGGEKEGRAEGGRDGRKDDVEGRKFLRKKEKISHQRHQSGPVEGHTHTHTPSAYLSKLNWLCRWCVRHFSCVTNVETIRQHQANLMTK